MKKTTLILLALLTFPVVFSKTNASALEPSLNASAVVTSIVPGQLNISLTITNTGDQVLTNINWFAPDSITFTTNNISYLEIGQTITIEGTRPFTACVYSGNIFVSAETLLHEPLPPFLVNLQYTGPQAAAPQVSSVTTSDCDQVPVVGNMQITLTGLPSGNWTLHGDNTSNYTYTGSGTTAVLNLNASVVGNGIRFYYDAPNGCPSELSQFVTRNELYNFDQNAPMLGTYFDANSDGVTNVGDQIIYQIMVTNTRSCPFYGIAINGAGSVYYNYFLSFSGNLNTSVDLAGYSTVAVPASYNITAEDISLGIVYNPTSVNPTWVDSLGGHSAVYYPSCITVLPLLSTPDVFFKNFTSYPNPVQSYWHIENTLSIEKVEIMTILGQSVRTMMVNNLSTNIDLSDLPSGSYLARVSAGSQIKIVKIIKS